MSELENVMLLKHIATTGRVSDFIIDESKKYKVVLELDGETTLTFPCCKFSGTKHGTFVLMPIKD